MIYILIAFVVLVLLLVYGLCFISSRYEQEIWCYSCENQQCENGCKWTEGSRGCKEYKEAKE